MNSFWNCTFRVLLGNAKDPYGIDTLTEAILVFCDFLSTYIAIIVIGIASTLHCMNIANVIESILNIDELLGVIAKFKLLPLPSFSSFLHAIIVYILKYIFGHYCIWNITTDIIIIIICMLNVQFSNTVRNLKKRFKVLNYSILRLFNAKKIQNSEVKFILCSDKINENNIKFHEIVDIHQQLCKVIQDICRAFGWQLIVVMLYYFVQLTLTLYYIYVAFTKSSLSLVKIVAQVNFFILFSTQLINITLPCHSTSQQASKTAIILSEQLNNPEFKYKREELLVILEQISYHEKEFSIFGLFTLNNGIIASTASGAVMYWAVLTQFQSSDKTGKK
ncbi:hypothetical protein O3M35_010361 [Rhynocoris fuscipes]|uniref:Gustatory receptor n=1 Tax=Rhynocoris fuscipes TaxID=488301 RepID=A0AAW1D029_9HEMI